MRRWLEQADEMAKIDEQCAVPKVSWNVLSRLRQNGERGSGRKEPEGIPHGAKVGEEDHKGGSGTQRMGNIATIMALVRPAFDASLVEGTKRQKSSMLKYWVMYCSSSDIYMQSFRASWLGTEDEVCEAVHR